MDNIKDWFEEVISLFRDEYQKLSEGEQKRIGNSWNFLSPCQIEVISFTDPTYQVIIITHFTWEDDLNFVIHKAVPIYDAIPHFEEILKEGRWQKELSDEDKGQFLIVDQDQTYGKIIEGFFLQIVKIVKGDVFVKHDENPQDSFGLAITKNHGFARLIKGDITKRNASSFVDGLIKEAKERTELFKKEQKPKSTENSVQGFGTYFYPPIWIDEIPQLTFREKMGVGGYLKYCKKSFDVDYNGAKVIVNVDGFIGVVLDDKETSKKILNKIMAVLLFNDISTETIRDSELENLTISDTWEIKGQSWSGQPTLRTDLGMEKWDMGPVDIALKRSKIPHNKLKAIIQQTEKVDPAFDNSLLFLLEAYTHFRHSEYLQSLFMSWLIIEGYLSEQLGELLNEKKATNKRKEKLQHRSIDYALEILNLAGKLEDKDYGSFEELKKKRDSIAHNSKKEITKNDADKCLNIAFALLKGKIGGV